MLFFLFKQKTAYEMRISDWSSDVCSSDLHHQSISVEITGLHPAGIFAANDHKRGGAIRPEAIDRSFVAPLPEEAAQGEGRLYEQPIVKLVEIQFIEQEVVEQPEMAGNFHGPASRSTIRQECAERAGQQTYAGGSRGERGG